MALTTSTNNYATSRFIVSQVPGQGNYTTISAAITAASSGSDILVMPGTYTEDLSLKTGVNISGMPADGNSFAQVNQLNNTVIVGRVNATNSGSCVLSNLSFQSNGSGIFICVTNNVQQLTIKNCQCLVLDTNCFDVENPNMVLDIYNTNVFLQNAVVNFNITKGIINCYFCNFISDHAAMSTNSLDGLLGGTLNLHYCFSSVNLEMVLATSNYSARFCEFAVSGTAGVMLHFDKAGTKLLEFCKISTGTNVAIDVTTTLSMYNCIVNSTNTNVITGSGTLTYGGNTFVNSKSITTTTKLANPLTVPQGGTNLNGVSTGQILYGSATNVYNLLTPSVDGYVLTLASGLPTWALPTAFQLPWIDNNTGIIAAINTGYFITGSCTVTLPVSPTQGQVVAFQVIRTGTISFTVACNVSQAITIGNSSSGTGATNTQNGDSLYLTYRSADSTWYSTETTGNWTLI